MFGHTFIGYVRKVVDTKRAGRLKVWIPELEGQHDDEASWILCNYCAPFAGATNWRDNSNEEFDTFEKTQTAYGFWAVPPDINNEVLVVFPNGDSSRALWVGCLYKEYAHHSVPANAYSDNNKNVDGRKVPVTEYNKFDKESGDAADPINPKRPWQHTQTEGVGNQGLIADEVRGITTSSSMRDEESAVYGMSTPGPKHETIEGARLGGHSFVLDDGVDSEHIELKTRSGAKLRIDETHGIVYAINKKGTAWIQMDEDGNVDIFGAESMSVRTQKNINFRADKDIIMEAGQNIYMKAAKDTDAELKIVGEDAGEGGNIHFHAINDMHTVVKKNKYTLVEEEDFHEIVKTGNKFEHVEGNKDVKTVGNYTETNTGDVNIKFEANETKNLTGDLNYKISGNEIKTNSGTLDNKVSGAAKLKAASYEINSANMKLESGGNVTFTGNGTFSGVVSSASMVASGSVSAASVATSGAIAAGGDVTSASASLNSLNGHTHSASLAVSGHSVASGTTAPFSSSGGGASPASPPADAAPGDPADASDASDPAEMTEALFKEMIDKTNILSTFPNTSATSNGGKNVEIPDWWTRDKEDVQTIVERLMTYEPCPEHLNRGNQE